MRRHPAVKSADLKTWEFVKVVVWRDQFKGTWPLKDLKNVAIWHGAALHQGQLLADFLYGRRGKAAWPKGFLKTARVMEGPYELVNKDGPITPGELDASFFEDDDGTVYFLSGGSSIAPMKNDMSGIAEKVRRVGAEGGGTSASKAFPCFRA